MPTAISAYQSGPTRVYTNDDGSTTVLAGGTVAWRNNNPGNIMNGPNAQAAGAIGQDDHGFAIFPNYQSGVQGMTNVLQNNYGNSTIDNMMQSYAPAFENNTTAFTAFLNDRVGATGSTTINNLSSDQFSRLQGAIQAYEGWRAGTITGPDNGMGGPGSPTFNKGGADPAFMQGGQPLSYIDQTQLAEQALGATSWLQPGNLPNVLSPADAAALAQPGAPHAAAVPYLDETLQAQQMLDGNYPQSVQNNPAEPDISTQEMFANDFGAFGPPATAPAASSSSPNIGDLFNSAVQTVGQGLDYFINNVVTSPAAGAELDSNPPPPSAASMTPSGGAQSAWQTVSDAASIAEQAASNVVSNTEQAVSNGFNNAAQVASDGLSSAEQTVSDDLSAVGQAAGKAYGYFSNLFNSSAASPANDASSGASASDTSTTELVPQFNPEAPDMPLTFADGTPVLGPTQSGGASADADGTTSAPSAGSYLANYVAGLQGQAIDRSGWIEVASNDTTIALSSSAEDAVAENNTPAAAGNVISDTASPNGNASGDPLFTPIALRSAGSDDTASDTPTADQSDEIVFTGVNGSPLADTTGWQNSLTSLLGDDAATVTTGLNDAVALQLAVNSEPATPSFGDEQEAGGSYVAASEAIQVALSEAAAQQTVAAAAGEQAQEQAAAAKAVGDAVAQQAAAEAAAQQAAAEAAAQQAAAEAAAQQAAVEAAAQQAAEEAAAQQAAAEVAAQQAAAEAAAQQAAAEAAAQQAAEGENGPYWPTLTTNPPYGLRAGGPRKRINVSVPDYLSSRGGSANYASFQSALRAGAAHRRPSHAALTNRVVGNNHIAGSHR
jgi:hypothetical protein